MLIDSSLRMHPVSLHSLIEDIDVHDSSTSFGADIDESNNALLDSKMSREDKAAAFLKWSARYQPCLFGRLGSKGLKGVGVDICWLDEEDISRGDAHLTDKIQNARREWKDRAAQGLANGFLIMFNSARLAYAKPGKKLLQACRHISNLYLIEHAPVEPDVVYTEAIPLKGRNGYGLFKAGINVFYPSAHRTRNHDRRIPGGIMISTNSPGQLANSLAQRGMAPSLESAVDMVLDLTLRSIGNGGIGHEAASSSSWHNIETDSAELAERCPHAKSLPEHVPVQGSRRFYSALYHTDVLVPNDVTADGTFDPDIGKAQAWPYLIMDYITVKKYPMDHVNYALFHGHPIADEARYHNPWPPRRASNHPLANY